MRKTAEILISDAVYFHAELTRKYHNLGGLRDENLLASAINAPFQTMFGQELYPRLEQKAARLIYGIINDHPFIDGNKRTGLHTMLVFLLLNDYEISYTQEEIENLSIGIAAKEISLTQIELWIKTHSNKTNSQTATE